MPEAPVRTPRPVSRGAAHRSAPLSTTDGFVLSRVDGSLNERELVAATGLKEDHVRASLSKLESLGLITFEGGPPAPATSSTLPPATRISSVELRAQRPSTPSTQHSASPPPSGNVPATPHDARPPAATEDDRAMGEPGDLEPALRRRVLALHRELPKLDYYALLGVNAQTDRKSIKRAYYDLAAQFHPDKYFRKMLGSFKPRMELIFARITLAHDTLTTRETRAEYDVYLEEQRRSRGMEELLAGATAETRRAEESVERAVRAQETPAGSPPPAPTSTSSAPLSPASGSRPSSPTVDAASRRDALARRLLAGRPTASSSAPPQRTSGVPPMAAADAVEALRRRYEEKVARAKSQEARKYVANADEAFVQGDFVAAANALRVASGLSPADVDLQERAKDAQAKADQVLGDMYARQARYEEKSNQFAEAARSWERVCKVRPNDATAHERAANALLQAGGDLHEAGRLGKRACDIHPENVSVHMTLANVYLAAGLVHSARKELETAAQLAPQDDTIQTLLKRTGKSA